MTLKWKCDKAFQQKKHQFYFHNNRYSLNNFSEFFLKAFPLWVYNRFVRSRRFIQLVRMAIISRLKSPFLYSCVVFFVWVWFIEFILTCVAVHESGKSNSQTDFSSKGINHWLTWIYRTCKMLHSLFGINLIGVLSSEWMKTGKVKTSNSVVEQWTVLYLIGVYTADSVLLQTDNIPPLASPSFIFNHSHLPSAISTSTSIDMPNMFRVVFKMCCFRCFRCFQIFCCICCFCCWPFKTIIRPLFVWI